MYQVIAKFIDGTEIIGARVHETIDTALERAESIESWWGPLFPALEVTVIANG